MNYFQRLRAKLEGSGIGFDLAVTSNNTGVEYYNKNRPLKSRWSVRKIFGPSRIQYCKNSSF